MLLTSEKLFVSKSLKIFDSRLFSTIVKHQHKTNVLKNFLHNSNYCRYLSSEKVNTLYTKEDVQSFKSTFPHIRKDLVEMVKQYDTKFVPEWVERSLKYNVQGGKNNRGQITVLAYKALADKSELTTENIKLAEYVGWCSEMFEAPLFMADDIVDGSETRRGIPCWYKLKDVGSQSINDILLLESATFIALQKYLSHTKYYRKLYEMFSEANFITYLGQVLDYHITKENVLNHTMDRYEGIVKYKTCYPAFYLPVAFALQMCGYTDPVIYNQAKSVLYEVGIFFQIRNDYLDSFGDPAKTGKNGTDIEENKISWLAMTTLEKANQEQRDIMESCYGKEDPVKVQMVRALYKKLGVDEQFLAYEKDSYSRVCNMIEMTSYSKLKPILQTVWDRIYSRNLR